MTVRPIDPAAQVLALLLPAGVHDVPEWMVTEYQIHVRETDRQTGADQFVAALYSSLPTTRSELHHEFDGVLDRRGALTDRLVDAYERLAHYRAVLEMRNGSWASYAAVCPEHQFPRCGRAVRHFGWADPDETSERFHPGFVLVEALTEQELAAHRALTPVGDWANRQAALLGFEGDLDALGEAAEELEREFPSEEDQTLRQLDALDLRAGLLARALEAFDLSGTAGTPPAARIVEGRTRASTARFIALTQRRPFVVGAVAEMLEAGEAKTATQAFDSLLAEVRARDGRASLAYPNAEAMRTSIKQSYNVTVKDMKARGARAFDQHVRRALEEVA